MELEASFPSDGEAFQLVGEGEGLLDGVAEFARALDVRAPLRDMTGMIRRVRSSRRATPESYALSPRIDSGRRRGRPGRPATRGMPSTRARVCAMSLTSAAVVMTWSGVLPSQIRWCVLPVFCRWTGDGPVASPLFGIDVGAVHARAGPVQFAGRVQLREQDAMQLIEDACLLPAVQVLPAGLSRAEPQLQGQELPSDALVQAIRNALQTQPVRHRLRPRRPLGPRRSATARSAPTSRRSRSTAASSHPPERSHRHNSHARPGPFNKIVL